MFGRGKTMADKLAARTDANVVRARKKAAKNGVDVDGALFVAHDLQADATRATLVVFPDRLEVHHHGRPASLRKDERGVDTYDVRAVRRVGVSDERVYHTVTVHLKGADLSYRTDRMSAAAAQEAIERARRRQRQG